MQTASEFVHNGIHSLNDVEECFKFTYMMTFGVQETHRDYRFNGRSRIPLGKISINTFQGKLAVFTLYNYAARFGQFQLDPHTEMIDLTK